MFATNLMLFLIIFIIIPCLAALEYCASWLYGATLRWLREAFKPAPAKARRKF